LLLAAKGQIINSIGGKGGGGRGLSLAGAGIYSRVYAWDDGGYYMLAIGVSDGSTRGTGTYFNLDQTCFLYRPTFNKIILL